MNRRIPRVPSKLRIWQQNAHKSKSAQLHILNTASPEDWDIIAIQEPWLDTFSNSRGSAYWRILYPTNHLVDENSRSRSIFLINTNISTDHFSQIDISSADITAVRFFNAEGGLSLFNVYNDCNHNNSIDALSNHLATNPPPPSDHMLWLGDFNRHHPLWESINNRHLNSSEANVQPLLDLLHDHDMDLALPMGIPTLETAAHNWTRPDNVWISHQALNLIISCDTDPSLRPALADHLPIITIIDMPIARSPPKLAPNFKVVDFEKFNTALLTRLNQDSPAQLITTKPQFSEKVQRLTTILQETIEAHALLKKLSPFSKRWWNSELTALKKRKSRLSNEAYKYRDIVNHPAKEENKKVSCEYALAIERVSKAHWDDWLENISAHQIYTANKFVTSDPTDFSSTRIPDLKSSANGAPLLASTNSDKVEALSSSFFLPPPPVNSVPENFTYASALPDIKFFSRKRIRDTAMRLKPLKAPGPDGIPNIILIKAMDVLIDHFFFIFRAVFELNVYHDQWLSSSTLVLRKPGKPAYNVAKAYCPIGLLNTMGKLLSTLVATDLSYLAEKHSLLPSGQFGGRPGRSTSDAILLLTHTIKDAWRVGKVAVALFLDVQGAFPNTVKERLIHNMKSLRVPSCYTKLTENMLTNRKSSLSFDDFSSEPINIINGTTQGCPLSMLFYTFYNAPLIQIAKCKNESVIGFVDDTMFLAVADSLQEAHIILKDMMERPSGGFSWSISHNSPFELSKLALMNFPRTAFDIVPADLVLTRRNADNTLTAQMINTVDTYKYLGVLLEPKLRWAGHHQRVIANAKWWSHQVSRLSKASGGMPPKRLRQLYNTVAVPAFTYAAEVWYMGVHSSPLGLKRLGVVVSSGQT
jgi:hypothetical protein